MTMVVDPGTLGVMMTTRLDRLRWVIDERANGNQRELARMANLAGGHVGVIMTRLRRDPNADIEGDTLAKISKATGVSPHWLVTGEGPRDVESGSGGLPIPIRVDRLLGSAALEEVLSKYPWPEDIAMSVADAVIADARAEAHANGVDRPQNLWHIRVGQLIKEHSGSSKTVHQRQMPAIDLDEESPEVQAFKAGKRRR